MNVNDAAFEFSPGAAFVRPWALKHKDSYPFSSFFFKSHSLCFVITAEIPILTPLQISLLFKPIKYLYKKCQFFFKPAETEVMVSELCLMCGST